MQEWLNFEHCRKVYNTSGILKIGNGRLGQETLNLKVIICEPCFSRLRIGILRIQGPEIFAIAKGNMESGR